MGGRASWAGPPVTTLAAGKMWEFLREAPLACCRSPSFREREKKIPTYWLLPHERVGLAYARWPLLPLASGHILRSRPPVPMLSAITTSNTRSILSNSTLPST